MSKKAESIVNRLLEDEGVWGRNMDGSAPDHEREEGGDEGLNIAEIWAEDKEGEYVQINDDGSVVYVAHGRAMETIPVDAENPYPGINAWMEAKSFFPNIWSVNDHGNVTLHDAQGNDLGGLV